MGGAKSAQEYGYDDVTAEKKVPRERIERKLHFVRIGKKSDDAERYKAAADEYNGAPEKRVPPEAVSKRREKFVRIGRKYRFVRIGKNSDVESESETESAAPRIRRKVHFVRIGRNPAAVVRTGQPYLPNGKAELPDHRKEPGEIFERRRLKFVRIGRDSGEKRSRSRRADEELALYGLQNMMV